MTQQLYFKLNQSKFSYLLVQVYKTILLKVTYKINLNFKKYLMFLKFCDFRDMAIWQGTKATCQGIKALGIT